MEQSKKAVAPRLLFATTLISSSACAIGIAAAASTSSTSGSDAAPAIYERSGPTAEAARHAPILEPALGAATPIAPADELVMDISAERRHQLQKYGPWITEYGLSDNGKQLLAHIADSRVHGFYPNAYDYEKLDALAIRLRVNARAPIPAGANTDTLKLRKNINELFANSFSQFAKHLGSGLVDARSVQRRLFRDPPSVDSDKLLSQLASGESTVDELVLSVAPQHADYRRLTYRMRDLLTERATQVARTKVDETGSLWVKHHHEDVFLIKRRLIETGELSIETVLTPMFDADLVVAVEAFQKRHGIAPSGVVDKRTRDVLNTTIDEEISHVAMSLERWRWMPRDLGKRYLLMNLPSYRLAMMNGAQQILDMVVVIGAQEHPTPTFSRDISYTEFNPTWTVPKSITNRELIPLERRKPGYLQARNFDILKVVDGNYKVVPFSSIGEDDFKKNPFPYVLRQRGGPKNALGRMKFMMPNPYSIYLHDTQAKGLFKKNYRAYSHGCIRLSDPDRLANLLMRIDGQSKSSINRFINKRKTSRYRFETPIPTHLTYITTWIDNDGLLQNRSDVYGHNPALEVALRTSDSLLKSLAEPGNSDAAQDSQLLATSDI